jgi:hypothetical protein
MRGVWDADAIRRSAIGLLWFSPSELREIRKTLSTCCPMSPIPASPNQFVGHRHDRDSAMTTPFDVPGDFVLSQASDVAQFDDLRSPRIREGQLVARKVQASTSMCWRLDGSASWGLATRDYWQRHRRQRDVPRRRLRRTSRWSACSLAIAPIYGLRC